MSTRSPWSAQHKSGNRKRLTIRQRQMLRDAYDHMKANGGNPGSWASLMRPCPRIGDLRVLNGLAQRGLMTEADHDDTPHRIEVWPQSVRITAAGAKEWERIMAERADNTYGQHNPRTRR